MRAFVDFVVHLRLPFQLALSVVWLWGVLWSEGGFSARTWWLWLAWTVALSGGATAYNSAFDRDEGPVGGLRRPPPVRPSLLWLSIALQLAGLGVVAAVGNGRDVALYVLAGALFVAYSTPPLRTKRRPWLSMATVGLGSGLLPTLAALFASPRPVPAGTALGCLAGFLCIAGFYPLTQVGQIDEDRRRGDRTFAVAYGRRAAFGWAAACLPLAGLIEIGFLARGGAAGTAALAGGLAALSLVVRAWWRRPALDGTAIADLLAYATALAFLIPVARALLGTTGTAP